MKVLNLVTTPRPFFNEQIRLLEKSGIETRTVTVPSDAGNRNVSNYIKFYLKQLSQSPWKYDIVHANYGLTAPFALAQPSRPVVLTLWGSDVMSSFPRLCRESSKYADAVILPSEHMATYLDTEYTVIPFGIDTDLFSPMSQAEARERLNWEKRKNIVLFPYRKSRSVKNYPLAKQVTNQIKDTELRQISDIPYEKMPLYMNASDCVLVTSDRESGPMVVKEAALCDVPVVSTNVGFAKQVLSGVTNSFVCDSNSELIERLNEVVTRNERSNGRKQLVDEVSLEKMNNELIQVYRQVLE